MQAISAPSAIGAELTASDAEPATEPVELSIVMPCLNEAETIASCVDKARHFLAVAKISGEVIVADNGSTDDSANIARAHGARVIAVVPRGYGHALMAGIVAARGTYIVMGDSDGSYDFAELSPFIAKLREGYDLVMGNRFKGGIEPGAMPALHRYFGNPVLTAIGRIFFRNPCGDFHCGLRAFRKSSVLAMNLRTTGMEFASEIVVKATLLKHRITEVPIVLARDGRTRPPHLRTWRDGWRHLRFLLLYSPRWLFLIPGLVLMSAGVIAGIVLVRGPQRVGPVTLDVHTLLYAAMAVLIGFQAISFAAFTKMFAIKEGLLPADPRIDRLSRYFTLEVGLLIGALMILAGIGGSLYAVWLWDRQSFGALDPSRMLRSILPAVTLLTLGCEIVFFSFFMSVLGLRRR